MEYINGSSVSQQNAINAKFKSVSLLNSSVAGYTPSNLDIYETAQLINLSVGGFTISTTTGILATRAGNIISLNIFQFQGVSTGQNLILAGVLPARFRPVVNLQFIISVKDTISEPVSPNFTIGVLEIDAATGNIIITRTANKQTFNNGAIAGIPSININFQQ